MENPATAIDVPGRDQELPKILGVRQAEALLVQAIRTEEHIVPYLTIGLFAGLRPAELKGLYPLNIEPGEGHIRVTAASAKRRRQRLVTIEENLMEWLEAYPPAGERLYAGRKAILRVREAAGVPWAPDIMRHSYASYHLARYQDAARTSLQLGHIRSDILFDHYRNLVTAREAERYWSIRPPAVAAKALRLQVATA